MEYITYPLAAVILAAGLVTAMAPRLIPELHKLKKVASDGITTWS